MLYTERNGKLEKHVRLANNKKDYLKCTLKPRCYAAISIHIKGLRTKPFILFSLTKEKNKACVSTLY